MGCGQSKIGNFYPKNKRNKNNSTKKNGDSIRSASLEQKNGNGKGNKTNNNGAEVNRNEDQNNSADKGQAKKKSNAPGSGPLLQQAEISTSQLDFFKMLDEKIENGPDYDESLDAATRAEHVSNLLRRWELASVTWSSSVSDLNNTSSTSTSTSLKNTPRPSIGFNSIPLRQNLTAKDREGMRNIIGGRPESAPVFMRNVANRVDGLQETHHCPSPSMPRHVLESITQSPTQSLKNSTSITAATPPGMSPTSLRYSQDSNSYGKECNSNQITPKITKIGAASTHYNMNNSSGSGSSSSGYPNQNQLNGGDFVAQQAALYREQYLQQTGIITIPPSSQYSSKSSSPVATANVLRNHHSSYVQQFQITSPQNYPTPRKPRNFNNAAQMT